MKKIDIVLARPEKDVTDLSERREAFNKKLDEVAGMWPWEIKQALQEEKQCL